MPQPVFLADFKQIKKIQCLSQSDGKALLDLSVEGARQVSTTTPLYSTSKSKQIHGGNRLRRTFVRRSNCPLVSSLLAAVDQRGDGPHGGEHDGPHRRLLPLGERHGRKRHPPAKRRCL